MQRKNVVFLEPSLYLFLLIVFTLIISAFFSGTEIAYISANRLKIALRKKEGSKIGSILSRFYDEPSQFLAAMLIGNNIALVIFGMLLETGLEKPVEQLLPIWLEGEFMRLLLITLFSTFIVLIFGEFVPKILFRLYASRILGALAYPLVFIRWLLSPIVWFTVLLSEWLLKIILRVDVKEGRQNFTRLDLENYIKSIQTKDTDEINTEMFKNALHLTKTTVQQCMMGRSVIEAVDVNASVDDLTNKFIQTQLSRLLIYDRILDNTIGYVHHLQLLKKPKNITEIVLEIPIIRENMPIRELLSLLLTVKSSIACVKNTKGEIVGVITLEDILEEVFGEIEDEYD